LSENGGVVSAINFIRTIWSLDDIDNWMVRFGFTNYINYYQFEDNCVFLFPSPMICKHVISWVFSTKGIGMLLAFPMKINIAHKLKRMVTDQSIVDKKNIDYIKKYRRKNIDCSCL
jgi:hypothetical protein